MPGYPARSFGPSRYQIEAEESTDPARLDELSLRKSSFVQSAVATNAHTTAATLTRLAESDNDWTRAAVGKNPNTPVEVLHTLAGDAMERVRTGVSKNPATPTGLLDLLAQDLVEWVRLAVAHNPNTSPQMLAALVSDVSPKVRKQVAYNAGTPDAALLPLVHDPSYEVRQAVAGRNFDATAPTEMVTRRRFRSSYTYQREQRVERGGRFTPDLITELAHSTDANHQYRAAAQPDAPEAALLHLARTGNTLVLKILAENRAAPASVLRAVAGRRDSESMARVAVHPHADDETLTLMALSRFTTVHTQLALRRSGGMEWLAAHDDPKVRIVAAKHLLDAGNALQATPGGDERPFEHPLTRPLLSDPDTSVQEAAAKAIPVRLLSDYVAHPTPKVRAVVAERSTLPDLLSTLAADSSALVRRRVANNRACPSDVLGVLASDRDQRVRMIASERFLGALGSGF